MVEEVTRYTATARRSGGWWMVQCDQLPGALSQVRSLAKAADVHREAIAFVSGQAADEIDVDVHAELAPDLAAELEVAEKLAEAARDSLDAASRKRRDVARQLAQQGVTMRDIGTLFGVSHQRAQQLVSDCPTPPLRPKPGRNSPMDPMGGDPPNSAGSDPDPAPDAWNPKLISSLSSGVSGRGLGGSGHRGR